MSLLSENAELAAAIAAATPERIEDPKGFDAVVVGAGAAGGMAAAQLTQAGLSTLVLDAGWDTGFFGSPVRNTISSVVRSVADPRLYNALPPRIINIGRRALRMAARLHQPVQARCFAWELAPQCFVDDRENPYITEPGTQFNWFRAHQIGGRMVIPGHGQQYYRFSHSDFIPEDGLSPSWGFKPEELDPWYEQIELKLGMTGGGEHSSWVPDSRLSKVLEPSPAEQQAIDLVRARWPDTQPILGRSALPLPSIVAAARSGRLYCRTGAMVSDVQVDDSQHVAGVRWYDRALGELRSVHARLVFLCASTLATTRILLASRSAANPLGLGGASGALGRHLMDHVLLSANATGGALPGEPVASEPGRCLYLPRFEARQPSRPGRRRYGVQIYRWTAEPGRSHFTAVSFAEMIPRPENRVVLDPHRRDAWGLPTLRINCRLNEQELATAAEQTAALRQICDALGVTPHRLDDKPSPPGTAIHECGTARMGDSPASSVLDGNNECWDARGLYVTDAAAFPSQGLQNPTLTILALTARACDHAVRLYQCDGQRAA
jgi:choline dehydrogenase-like flavoprotein